MIQAREQDSEKAGAVSKPVSTRLITAKFAVITRSRFAPVCSAAARKWRRGRALLRFNGFR